MMAGNSMVTALQKKYPATGCLSVSLVDNVCAYIVASQWTANTVYIHPECKQCSRMQAAISAKRNNTEFAWLDNVHVTSVGPDDMHVQGSFPYTYQTHGGTEQRADNVWFRKLLEIMARAPVMPSAPVADE